VLESKRLQLLNSMSARLKPLSRVVSAKMQKITKKTKTLLPAILTSFLAIQQHPDTVPQLISVLNNEMSDRHPKLINVCAIATLKQQANHWTNFSKSFCTTLRIFLNRKVFGKCS
jgi:hypothetical protein